MELGEKRRYKETVFRGNSKRPFVEFWVWSESDGGLKKKVLICPKKKYSVMNTWAKYEIKRINEALKEGYHFREALTIDTNNSPTLMEALGKAMAFKSQILRPRSIDTYYTAYNCFFEFLKLKKMENIHADSLPPNLSHEFCVMLKSKRLTNKTVNNRLELVKSLIKFAKDTGIIFSDFSCAKLPETQTDSNKAFTPGHAQIITEYMMANDYELYTLTQTMYHTFIRPRELRQIKISDFDFQNRRVIVKGEISKNRKKEAVILNNKIIKILQFYAGSENEKKYIFGKQLKCNIVQSSVNEYYNRHRKVLEKLGLHNEGYTLYSWKHTGVCNAFISGLNIKKLQNLLRHSSIAITDIYLKSLNLQNSNEILEGW